MTRLYRRFLAAALARRRTVLVLMAALLVLGVYGFGKIPPAFFPQSARPQFVVDYWLPQGTHFQRTLDDPALAEIPIPGTAFRTLQRHAEAKLALSQLIGQWQLGADQSAGMLE